MEADGCQVFILQERDAVLRAHLRRRRVPRRLRRHGRSTSSCSPAPGSASTEKTALIIESPDDPRLSSYERGLYADSGTQSEICVPLVLEDRVVGAAGRVRPSATRLRGAPGLPAPRRPDDGRGVRERAAHGAPRGEQPDARPAGGERHRVRGDARQGRGAAERRPSPLRRHLRARTATSSPCTATASAASPASTTASRTRVRRHGIPGRAAGTRARRPRVPAARVRDGHRHRRACRATSSGGRTSAGGTARCSASRSSAAERSSASPASTTTTRAAFARTDFLHSLAQVAAGALANATLFDELDRSAERMALVGDVSFELTSSLDLDEVLLSTARRLCAISGAPMCDIYTLHDGASLQSVISIDGESVDLDWQGRTFALDEWTAMRKVVESREPVISPQPRRPGPLARRDRADGRVRRERRADGPTDLARARDRRSGADTPGTEARATRWRRRRRSSPSAGSPRSRSTTPSSTRASRACTSATSRPSARRSTPRTTTRSATPPASPPTWPCSARSSAGPTTCCAPSKRPRTCTTSARSACRTGCCSSRAASTDTSGSSCGSIRSSAPRSSGRCSTRRSSRACAITTSAGTATATRMASPARPSPPSPAPCAWPTPTTRCRSAGRTGRA